MWTTLASERPRLAVAADGSQLAVAEGGGIGVIELPARRRTAEINIDPDADSYDVGWLGTRLVVLSRFGSYTTVHLVDPSGPRTLSEIQLESPVRLYATAGSYALVGGARGVAVLSATETHVTPYQFPARSVPTAACSTAARFMVAVPGAVEEWDPQSRVPTRRLRLPRPATITAVGASERVVWMTTQQDPSRIDVVPLVNRGQPKAHDLDEPIAFAIGHYRSEIVICLGAQTGKLFAIDLDGKTRHRVLSTEGLDRVDAAVLVASRSSMVPPSVAIVQAARPPALVSLAIEPRESDGQLAIQLPWTVGEPVADPERVEPELPTDSLASISTRANIAAPWGARAPTSPGIETPLGFSGPQEPGQPESSWQSSLVEPEPTAAARAFPSSRPSRPDVLAPVSAVSSVAEAPPPRAGQDLSRRFSAWRERLKESGPTATPASTTPDPSTGLAPSSVSLSRAASLPDGSIGVPTKRAEPPPAEDDTWSPAPSPVTVAPILSLPVAPATAPSEPPTPAITIERVPTWRDELVGWRHARGPVPAVPAVPAIEQLAQRFDLSHDQVVVIALLYAAHLAGEAGIAPVDAARIVGWDDALGRGDLARARLTTLDGSRLRLEDPIARVLDEREPRAGVVVGAPGPSTLLGPCAMLANGESPLAIAERARASIGGGILVATRALDIETLFLEARARGLVPLVPLRALGGVVRSAPCVIVVDDPAVLDELDVPRL